MLFVPTIATASTAPTVATQLTKTDDDSDDEDEMTQVETAAAAAPEAAFHHNHKDVCHEKAIIKPVIFSSGPCDYDRDDSRTTKTKMVKPTPCIQPTGTTDHDSQGLSNDKPFRRWKSWMTKKDRLSIALSTSSPIDITPNNQGGGLRFAVSSESSDVHDCDESSGIADDIADDLADAIADDTLLATVVGLIAEEIQESGLLPCGARRWPDNTSFDCDDGSALTAL